MNYIEAAEAPDGFPDRILQRGRIGDVDDQRVEGGFGARGDGRIPIQRHHGGALLVEQFCAGPEAYEKHKRRLAGVRESFVCESI